MVIDAPPDETAISAKASVVGWVIIGAVIGPSIGACHGVVANRHRRSHRSGEDPWQTVREIDPGERVKISSWVAIEWTHAGPQSSCVKDVAFLNM